MIDVNDKKAHHLLQNPRGVLGAQLQSQVLPVSGLQLRDAA